MVILLDQFEEYIEPKILKRGLDYFHEDAVEECWKFGKGSYGAFVAGSSGNYKVEIEIDKKEVLTYTCNCPYDYGDICKHIVAVLFYIREEQGMEEVFSGSHAPTPKKAPIQQQLEKLLPLISHQDLIAFIQKYSQKDIAFGSSLVTTFNYLDAHQSKASYAAQIQALVDAAADRTGWIEYRAMSSLMNNILPFLKEAEDYLQQGEYAKAFTIGTAVLEVMTTTISSVHDSGGHLSGLLESALELLVELSQQSCAEALRKEILAYSLANITPRVYEEWDYHALLLETALNLVKEEQEVADFLKLLEKEATTKDNYDRKQVELLILELLKKFKSPVAVEEFTQAHLNNPDIREQELIKAFETENYAQVIAFAKEGIQENSSPRATTGYYEWLLKVALAQKDTPTIVEHTRFLFVNNPNFQEVYYHLLKGNMTPKQWPAFLKKLIKELSQRWIHHPSVYAIHIQEKSWEQLLSLLQQDADLFTIEKYEQHLTKDYSPELVQLYSSKLVPFLEQTMGRAHYQKVCSYLSKMKNLGGEEEVNLLIQSFREHYPKRRALLEELAKV